MRILRWVLIAANGLFFLFTLLVIIVWAFIGDPPPDDAVIFVVFGLPYSTLNFVFIYFTSIPKGSWLGLEIEARKAKLRQHIRERGADAKN